LPAVTPADDAGAIARFAQQLDQPHGQRGFSRAADTDIADHDHRNAYCCAVHYPAPVKPAAHPHHQAEQRTERPQQHGNQIQ